jgi:hypothetical protein
MFGEVTGAWKLKEGKLAMDFYGTPRHCECLFLVQVFSSWMHICAIRIFTESILRYGLPPQFLAAVLAPSAKNEKKVRTTLESLCDGRNRYAHWLCSMSACW